MTWKFVHKLFGPALFGSAGVHWNFTTPNDCHSAAERDMAWRNDEFTPRRPPFRGGYI